MTPNLEREFITIKTLLFKHPKTFIFLQRQQRLDKAAQTVVHLVKPLLRIADINSFDYMKVNKYYLNRFIFFKIRFSHSIFKTFPNGLLPS